MVKALRSCLEAAKGKIKAGHLILRKSPKRTATGSSTASNISRRPIRHAGYSLLVPGILESRMSQETASYWQSPSSREKLSFSDLPASGIVPQLSAHPRSNEDFGEFRRRLSVEPLPGT